MKLSEVQQAHDLVAHRRCLVKAYVAVGTAAKLNDSPFPWTGGETAFGCAVDEPMLQALRVAARKEIRRRIDQADRQLADLGVEVDGLAIAIRSEEERLAEEKAKREAAVQRPRTKAEAAAQANEAAMKAARAAKLAETKLEAAGC